MLPRFGGPGAPDVSTHVTCRIGGRSGRGEGGHGAVAVGLVSGGGDAFIVTSLAGTVSRVALDDFTVHDELPFAGHPNVGTGFVVAGLGSLFGPPVGGSLGFEEVAGLVPISILKECGAVTGGRLAPPRADRLRSRRQTPSRKCRTDRECRETA